MLSFLRKQESISAALDLAWEMRMDRRPRPSWGMLRGDEGSGSSIGRVLALARMRDPIQLLHLAASTLAAGAIHHGRKKQALEKSRRSAELPAKLDCYTLGNKLIKIN